MSFDRRSLAIVTLIALAVAAVAFILLDPSRSQPGGGDHFSRIDSYVEDQMAGSRIPGVAIAILEGDDIVHSRGFGNDGNGNAITAETPFWIGSNTKSMTALAIAQLAEAGKLELDAPVQRYLPDFAVADAAAASQITIRHLLNDTSGFSRNDGLDTLISEEVKTLEEEVADLRHVQLNRPVGESFEYSNLNFVVLGLVIERVSGQTWAEYFATNIFAPLQMTRTYTSLEEAEAAGLTAVHRYAFGLPLQTEQKYLPSLAPSGFVYSTATDMARYLAMYVNGGTLDGRRILSEEGVQRMLAGATNDATRQLQGHQFRFQYGEGWFVGPFGAADDARWHLGNLNSFTAWIVLLPETEQAVVVLINAGSQFEIAGANAVMTASRSASSMCYGARTHRRGWA